MSEKRPFFSLVIPCYNNGVYAPGNYIDQLLSSVLDQGLDKEDIEVIISDDRSPLKYDTIIDRFRNLLDIKCIQTDINGGPGYARQKGADTAIGQWLCFADHDDLFYPNMLKHVKNQIERTTEAYVVYSNFNKVDQDDHSKIVEKFRKGKLGSWIHGKFYNLDNFWKPFGIHFIDNLRTCEDIALGVQVNCALHRLGGKQPLHISKCVYMWVDNSHSISNQEYQLRLGSDNQLHSFVEFQFSDIVRSEIVPLVESVSNGILDKKSATVLMITAMCKLWIYMNQMKNSNSCYYDINNVYVAKAWNDIKNTLRVNAPMVKVILSSSMKDTLDLINAESHEVGHSFFSWLDYIDTLDQNKSDSTNNIVPTEVNLPEVNLPDPSVSEPIRATSDLTEVDPNNHRPFFSVVIACYNDGRYKEGVYLDRLLASISRQGIERCDLEVILSDDCSPVSFDWIIKKHESEMMIKYIKTDYNFAPGNTRAKGVTIATGIWLCFADHDDIFYDNALSKIRNAIAEKNEQHFIFGDFHGVSPDGKVLREYKCHLNWCHGKFYNKDNFWDKYGIHFIPDLKSHEDIAICTQVSCAIASYLENYSYLGLPVYAWTDNPQSVSHAKYTVETETGPREFLEVFFEDYITATGYIYLEQFDKHLIKMEYALKGILEIMLYCYFYMQGFQFRRPEDYYRKNVEIAGKYVSIAKKKFNMTNQTIYNAAASNNASMYYRIRPLSDGAAGHYMPTQTFRQWLDFVSPEDYIEASTSKKIKNKGSKK